MFYPTNSNITWTIWILDALQHQNYFFPDPWVGRSSWKMIVKQRYTDHRKQITELRRENQFKNKIKKAMDRPDEEGAQTNIRAYRNGAWRDKKNPVSDSWSSSIQRKLWSCAMCSYRIGLVQRQRETGKKLKLHGDPCTFNYLRRSHVLLQFRVITRFLRTNKLII